MYHLLLQIWWNDATEGRGLEQRTLFSNQQWLQHQISAAFSLSSLMIATFQAPIWKYFHFDVRYIHMELAQFQNKLVFLSVNHFYFLFSEKWVKCSAEARWVVIWEEASVVSLPMPSLLFFIIFSAPKKNVLFSSMVSLSKEHFSMYCIKMEYWPPSRIWNTK